MTQKTETETLERIYTVPLREKMRAVPRYKRTPKAIRVLRAFVSHHLKVRIESVKIMPSVNETLWSRGIKHPVHKIKIKAIKKGDVVTVEAVALPKAVAARVKSVEKRSAEHASASPKKAPVEKQTPAEKTAETEKEISVAEVKQEEQKHEHTEHKHESGADKKPGKKQKPAAEHP